MNILYGKDSYSGYTAEAISGCRTTLWGGSKMPASIRYAYKEANK
jgi:hypothetical protein